MNRHGKLCVLLAVALMLAFAVFAGGCSTGSQGVGVLDMNKIMSDSPKVKQMQEQLNAKGKEISDQMEKDKASLSPEEFQKRQESVYNDFVKTKQDYENQIDTSVKQALDQIAKDKKLGVVLYKNGVANGGTDVTDEVIKKMQ